MESKSTDDSDFEEIFVSNSYAVENFKKMKELQSSRLLTDITLVSSGKKITAHKLVLSAASDYFCAMFTHDVKEATMTEIKLENIQASTLEVLVEFCYSGQLYLREDNVEMILEASKFLQFNEVASACCRFLMSRLDPTNCIGFALFAEALNCVDLYEASHNYIMDNFTDVIQNQEFLTLSAENLKKLLSSDMLNVEKEETAFESLLLWLNFSPTDRKDDLPILLAHIKLPLVSPQFLADHIEMYPVLKEHPKCYNLILEAMQYHLLPERRSLLYSLRTKPRKSTVGSLFAIGGMDGGRGSWQIEEYNMRINAWVKHGVMTSRRLQFGAAVIDNKLYVVGGRDGLKTLNIVECYDFKTKSWSAMPSMCTHRHGLGVAVLGGPLYAVGGHDGWTYLSGVERWDPGTRQWSYVSPLNTHRSTAGVAVLNDRLYAVGGRDGSSCLKSVECFDPHRNRWSFCAPMTLRRGGAGVGVINNYLFVLGGHDAPILNPGVSRFECVERYDPRTDTWTTVAPMKIGRDAIGVGVLGGYLIAIGGYDGQSYLNIVESYDPEKNEWEEIKELPEGRAGMCVVVIKL